MTDDVVTTRNLALIDPAESPERHESSLLRAAPELSRGTAINRYLIIEFIGRGGMGSVYRAYDPQLDRGLAIKLVDLRRCAARYRRELRERLFREAKALAKISHANVVSVYDVGTFEGDVFVAMELVEGTTFDRWLEAVQPTHDAILDALIQAGRGLTAAHAEGLIHRDFKPTNILMGSDGRARVVDFGLARSPDEPGEGFDAPPSTAPDDPPHRKITADDLTLPGEVLGTPGYMSPEQLFGTPLDHRSDQFSFCVTLFRALYGVRPFPCDDVATLSTSFATNALRVPPAEAQVRPWVHRALVRGLSIDPNDRFESMHDLLEVLGHDPWQRRKRRLGSAAALTSGALAVVTLRSVTDANSGSSCSHASDKLESIVGEPRNDTLARAFEASEHPHPSEAHERVVHRLRTFATEWEQQYAEACQANGGDLAPERLLDLRMACLERNTTRVGALLDVLQDDPSPEFIDKAVLGIDSVVDLDFCRDVSALTALVPPPRDPDDRSRVDSLREELARARALEIAGRYTAALETVDDVIERATSIDYAPLVAAAGQRKGSVLGRLGRLDEALDASSGAIEAAARAKDFEVHARAWIDFMWTVGYLQRRTTEGLALSEAAKAAVALAGDRGELRAMFTNRVGVLMLEAGDLGGAREHLEAAVNRFSQKGSPYQSAAAHNNLGLALSRAGRLEAARTHFEVALEGWESAVGSHHPILAAPLMNLGQLAEQRWDWERAEAYYRRTLSVEQTRLSPDDPRIAQTASNLAEVAMRQGLYDVAAEALEEAMRISEAALEAPHVQLALIHSNIGLLAFRQGNLDEGVRHFEEAVSQLQSSPDYRPVLPRVMRRYASQLCAHGRPEAASSRFDEVKKHLHSLESDVGQEWVQFHLERGRCRLSLGQTRAARDDLERAFRGAQDAALDGPVVAEIQWLRARAIAATDPSDAKRAAEAALAELGKFEGSGALRLRDEIAAWLSR